MTGKLVVNVCSNLGINNRGNGHLLFIPIQSELASLASAIVHWPPLYSLTKHARFCEPGVVTFSRRHLLFVCRRELLEDNWGKTGGVLVS